MAVRIQFISVMVPIARILAVPGLQQQLAQQFPDAWHDGHLWCFAAMSPPQHIAEVFERSGFQLREETAGGRVWKDICIVDFYGGPTLPCAWLNVDMATKTAWLKGTVPGPVVEPRHTHEANPVKVALGPPASPPLSAPPIMSHALPPMPHPHAPMPNPQAFAAPAPPHLAPAQGSPPEAALPNLENAWHAHAAVAHPTLLSGSVNAVAAEERKWRIWRIGALALLALRVLFTGPGGPGFYPEQILWLIPTGPVGLLLYGAIAVQVYGLVRPAHRRPRTLVFLIDHSGGAAEVIYIGAGVVLGYAASLGSGGFIYGGPIATLFHLGFAIVPILMVALRTTVVLDGASRTATRIALWPQRISFDAVKGLGLYTIRVQGGGTTHYLGLFPAHGQPWKLSQLGSQADLPRVAAEVIRVTGLPHR